MNTNTTTVSHLPGKRIKDVSNESVEILKPDELTMHIQRCALNDRHSQEKIYQTFYGFSMAICKRYANNHDDAIEILNDGFLKIFKEMYRYEPAYADVAASFRGWVRKIMICASIDHFRRNKKHNRYAEIDNEMIQLANHNENALDRLSYREIIGSIQKVTPVYQTVLNLFIIEGFSHQEIADQLGITVGTSKSNLAKARVQLQKILFQRNEITYKKRERHLEDEEPLSTMKTFKQYNGILPIEERHFLLQA